MEDMKNQASEKKPLVILTGPLLAAFFCSVSLLFTASFWDSSVQGGLWLLAETELL